MFLSVYVNAQTKLQANISDFTELKSRTLVVVLEDNIEKQFSVFKAKVSTMKNEKKRLELEELIKKYGDKINHFNTVWPVVIKENWALNKNIIFKSKSEFEKLKESNSTEYAVLFFKDLKNTFGSMMDGFSTQSISRLFYTKIENIDKKMKKADYFFVFQNFLSEGSRYYDKATYKLNINLLQSHILEIEKKQDKKYVFPDYARNSRAESCSKLKDNEVLVYKNTLYKMARKNPNKSFTIGNIKAVEREEIAEAILNEKDVIIGVPCMSHISSNIMIYYKILVNAKTLEIVSCTRRNSINEFLRADLKALNTCK